MDKSKLERLFEQMLAEPNSGDDARLTERRNAIAAALARVRAGEAAADDAATPAKLAAYLDGALDEAEAEAFAARLGDVHELEAAQDFLSRVSAETTPVPPELVAAVTAESVRKTRKPAAAARRVWLAPWGRQWGWAGGALAAVLLAVVISDNLKDKAIPSAPVVSDDVIPLAPKGAPAERPAEPALPQTATVPPPAPLPVTPPQPAAPRVPPPAAVTVTNPPPPAPALPASVAVPPPREEVTVMGSLIRGTVAVGVPVTTLDAAQASLPPPPPPPAPPAPVIAAPPPVTTAITNTPPPPQASARVFGFAPPAPPVPNRQNYPNATPNPVKVAAQEPVSTFSVDVDTASYSNVRRFLTRGQLPPANAVRVEEMINYFDYQYPVPRDRAVPFLPTVAVYPTPWNPDTQILHIGIKGFDLAPSERPRANLVFLIDTSGSMMTDNKLPLLKRAFGFLVEQLRREDRVAIVTYAGSAGLALEPTSGADKATIMAAIDRLQAGGSTAGGAGIRLAYQLAEANFDREGVNRVLLTTDGDFNVGITDPSALQDYIAGERASGVFLTVLGFGVDNYNDLMMQKLAQAGNGVAAYIDTINEAQKLFVNQITGTLFTIAKDVKIQVEFNPARVAEYRLIGYETRLLNQTDFNNDKVDAGDVGSGHTVTALYEITPVGSRAQLSDPSRYGPAAPQANTSSEFAFVKIRYKLPAEDESRLLTRPVTNRDVQRDFAKLPPDLRFAAAVAGTGQLLRRDPSVKSFDFGHAIEIAEGAKGGDAFGYRAEFISLLQRGERVATIQAPRIQPPSFFPRPARLGEPVDAAANPPQPLGSHAVTADDYPPVSVRLQEQGTVTVRYVVEADGSVSGCTVETTSGRPRLDDAACVLVRKWRYTPATLAGGQAVPMWLGSTINFELR